MFHRSWRPIPRPRVSALIQQYEEVTIAAGLPRTPPRNSLEINANSPSRRSYILDSVPEDPSDADDYMIPHISAASSAETPDSPHKQRNRRSLPRTNYSVPTVIVPDHDTPMPDAWTRPHGEISPTTIPAWPMLAEAYVEEERVRKLNAQQHKTMWIGKARRLMHRSAGIVRKIAGKPGTHLHRRPSSPRRSEDTFVLRTPKRKLESQPSVKSRAKRVARGAMHSLVHLSVTSVDAVGNAREATSQTAKRIRKSANRTQMRVLDRVEDAKEKVSTSLPIIRPPRSWYSPLAGNSYRYAGPLIQDTHTTPGSQPWSAPADIDEPWPTGIIPPPPTPLRSRQRNRLRKRNPYPSPSLPAIGESSTSSHLPNKAPIDAIFAQALVSDVEWQAKDAIFPMIIVTEGANNREGSWYLPVNSARQIQLREASASRVPPTPSNSTRSSVGSTGSSRFARTKKWYNGRLSFGSTRSSSGYEDELRGSDDRRLKQVLVSYTDRTPLLVELLSAAELEARSAAAAKGRRKALLWAPVGRVLL